MKIELRDVRRKISISRFKAEICWAFQDYFTKDKQRASKNRESLSIFPSLTIWNCEPFYTHPLLFPQPKVLYFVQLSILRYHFPIQVSYLLMAQPF